MPTRTADAVWNGNLIKGSGTVKFGSGLFEGSYSFPTRFERVEGTSPEELIAAAHSSCFSMAFSAVLAEAGYEPRKVNTTANVSVEKVNGGFSITGSALSTSAEVPGIDEDTFHELAQKAKETCPVSRALSAIPITLEAKLEQ